MEGNLKVKSKICWGCYFASFSPGTDCLNCGRKLSAGFFLQLFDLFKSSFKRADFSNRVELLGDHTSTISSASSRRMPFCYKNYQGFNEDYTCSWVYPLEKVEKIPRGSLWRLEAVAIEKLKGVLELRGEINYRLNKVRQHETSEQAKEAAQNLYNANVELYLEVEERIKFVLNTIGFIRWGSYLLEHLNSTEEEDVLLKLKKIGLQWQEFAEKSLYVKKSLCGESILEITSQLLTAVKEKILYFNLKQADTLLKRATSFVASPYLVSEFPEVIQTLLLESYSLDIFQKLQNFTQQEMLTSQKLSEEIIVRRELKANM